MITMLCEGRFQVKLLCLSRRMLITTFSAIWLKGMPVYIHIKFTLPPDEGNTVGSLLNENRSVKCSFQPIFI